MVRHVICMLAASALSSPLLAAAPQSEASAGGQAKPPCVAILLPSVQGVEGNATEVAASLRELFTSYLKGPSMQVVALDARLASQAVEEARQKQCDHVLATTLTRKRGGGGGGLLGRVAGQAGTTAALNLPGSNVGAAVARGAAVAATQAASDLAGSTKAKDEMRLEYRLLSSGKGSAVLGPKTERAKAESDGEDLVTPLVEKTAEAVVAAMRH